MCFGTGKRAEGCYGTGKRGKGCAMGRVKEGSDVLWDG